MQRRVRHTHAAGRKGNAIHRWQKGKPQSAGQESKGQTTGRRCRKEAPDRSLGAPAWSWGGVRTCGKGRSALRPPNTAGSTPWRRGPTRCLREPAEEQCAWARKTPWLMRGGVGREHCLHPARSKGLSGPPCVSNGRSPRRGHRRTLSSLR